MSAKSGLTGGGSTSTGEDSQARIKATAIRHALEIEAKKKLQNHVSDLAYRAFDLPSQTDADPARPIATDLALFQDCLKVFRPQDLDDLVDERNIDNRCGYTLCPKPNEKLSGRGEKVWNRKVGSEFGFVDKAEKERWCSDLCGKRNAFVRRQLKKEPAWLRESQNSVRLLDNIDSLEKPPENATVESHEEDTRRKLQELQLERGKSGLSNENNDITIFEKEASSETSPPQLINNNLIEGLPIRNAKPRQTYGPDS